MFDLQPKPFMKPNPVRSSSHPVENYQFAAGLSPRDKGRGLVAT